jgi:hypothetical protein
MANKPFIVHNGLSVGALTIDAATGDITTSGNMISTSSGSTNTIAVQKYLMQLPINLGSSTWYKFGTFTATSAAGYGETVEITITGGQGFAGDSTSKDVIQVRILSGQSPNVEANYYNFGYREAIAGIKVKSVNSSATDKSWDIYGLIKADAGAGVMEIKHNADSSTFEWSMTASGDPGSASSTLVVATNKLVTASANVVVTTGNLYVGGNIYMGGLQVSTFTSNSGNGWTTDVITSNGTTGPFGLSKIPADKDQIAVWWNGIFQPKATYTLVSNSLQFTEAPPTGSTIEVKILAGTGAQSLGTLVDINFTASPTDGQFLAYNASEGKWKPVSSLAASTVTDTAIKYAIVLGGL